MSKQEPIRFQGQYLESDKFFHICGGIKKKKGEKLLFYPSATASLSLDGVNDHARSGNGSALAAFNPGGGNGLCIAFEIYPQGTLGTDVIISYGKLGTGANMKYRCYFDANNNKLNVDTNSTAGAPTRFETDASIFNLNAWNKVAITLDYSGAQDEISIWVNGTKATGSYISRGNTLGIGTVSGTTNGRFCVGAHVDYLGTYHSNPFQGYINNLCISGGGDNGYWTEDELETISKTYNIDYEAMGYMNNSTAGRGVIYRFENNTNSEWTLSRNLELRSGATYTTNVP